MMNRLLYLYCVFTIIYGFFVNSALANLINKRSASTEKTSICYANNNDPYTFFGTKTSYFKLENEDVSPIKIEGKTILVYKVLVYKKRSDKKRQRSFY